MTTMPDAEPFPDATSDASPLAGWWSSGRTVVPGTTGPITDDGELPRIEGP
jgi:hypothetical protein